MKIAHWTLKNGSGMHRVAEDISTAERALGYDSICQKSDVSEDWEGGMGADVHVCHSHVPESVQAKGGKIVWVGHGTPEHCFENSVVDGTKLGYGASDCMALIYHWMKNADALVTFWGRHQKIWKSLCDKSTKVHCLPLGVNKEFWKPVGSNGKYAGDPSIFTAENCHTIKWPLDLILSWPTVMSEYPDARLHINYLPYNQHRFWFPLLSHTGALITTFASPDILAHENLRNAFCSVDYYIGLVRYGDYNRICLEAKASGAKVISYYGNPYADYWIPEGSHELLALKLREIIRGDVIPRDTMQVPDISETAKGMIKIYEGLMENEFMPENKNVEEKNNETISDEVKDTELDCQTGEG